MKRRKESSGLGTAVAVAGGAILGCFLGFFVGGPVGMFVGGMFGSGLAKEKVDNDLDEIVGDNAEELYQTWKSNRPPEESTIETSHTVPYCIGGIITLPATREYISKLNRRELRDG